MQNILNNVVSLRVSS